MAWQLQKLKRTKLTLEDDDVDGPLNRLLPKAKKEMPDGIGTSHIRTDKTAGIGKSVH